MFSNARGECGAGGGGGADADATSPPFTSSHLRQAIADLAAWAVAPEAALDFALLEGAPGPFRQVSFAVNSVRGRGVGVEGGPGGGGGVGVCVVGWVGGSGWLRVRVCVRGREGWGRRGAVGSARRGLTALRARRATAVRRR